MSKKIDKVEKKKHEVVFAPRMANLIAAYLLKNNISFRVKCNSKNYKFSVSHEDKDFLDKDLK